MKKTSTSKSTKIITQTKSSVNIQTKTLILLSMFLMASMGIMATSGLLNKNKTILNYTKNLNVVNIDFTIDIPAIKMETIENEGVEYKKILLADDIYFYSQKAGTPQLPYLKKQVAIPDQATNFKLSFETKGEIIFEDILVYPVPNCDCEKQEFFKDDVAYKKNSFVSPVVEMGQAGFVRSQKLIDIVISPIQYNPSIKTLVKYDSIKIKLTYTVDKSLPQKINRISSESSFIKDLVVNPENVKISENLNKIIGSVNFLDRNSLFDINNNVDYLIITHSDFYGATQLNDFANYRASNDNYRVGVVQVQDIYVDFPSARNDQSIKNFVQYTYDNWATAPSLLLILGDTNWIPTHDGGLNGFDPSPINDDKWYARVSGADDIPDMALGRLSVTSNIDIENILNKIEVYENSPIVVGDYHYKSTFLDDIAFDYRTLQAYDIINQMGLDREGFQDATAQAAIDNFSSNFLLYFGHGATSLWNLPPTFNHSTASLVVNNFQTPFVLSVGCRTGRISSNPNIGEEFVKVSQKGAIGWYASSVIWAVGPALDNLLKGPMATSFDYRAGMNAWYSDIVYPDPQVLLQADPGLHLFGYRADPILPDLAISQERISANISNSSVRAEINNLGSTAVNDVLVELYLADDVNNMLFMSSSTIDIAANSINVIELPVEPDLPYGPFGYHNFYMKVNSRISQNHIEESFDFNNNAVKSLAGFGLTTVVTYLDSNNNPLANEYVAFKLPSYTVGFTTNAQGQVFANLPLGSSVILQAWAKIRPINSERCLAVENSFIAPNNIVIHRPNTASQLFFHGLSGAEESVSVIAIEKDTSRQLCTGGYSGLDYNFYIKPDSNFKYRIFYNGSFLFTSVLTAPIKAHYCLAGNCCLDGTLSDTCSLNNPMFCRDNNTLVEDCERCGCPGRYTCKIDTNGSKCIEELVPVLE